MSSDEGVEFQATIDVVKYPRMQMFLRELVGEGETPDGDKFTVMSTVPTRSLLVQFEDRETYLFDMNEMVNAALVERRRAAAAKDGNND